MTTLALKRSPLVLGNLSVTGLSKAATAAAASSFQQSSWIFRGQRVKMASTWQPTINLDNLNPCIKTMEYAVRGPLVIRATEIEKEIQSVSRNAFWSYLLTT